MRNTLVVFKRELAGYFCTPVAYVFLIVFLALSGYLTWSGDRMYRSNQADLQMFFGSLPLVFLALVPALCMRMWAEERRQGTIELLLTLPISSVQAVMGKFFAAWCFTAVALALTVTEWISVSYLGDPDHGVIVASYFGAFLMAGSFIAIGSCISALTKNQVIAFVLALIVSFLFIVIGHDVPLVGGIMPAFLVNALRYMSFQIQFEEVARGVIDVRHLIYFVSLIGFFLFANTAIVDLKKAD